MTPSKHRGRLKILVTTTIRNYIMSSKRREKINKHSLAVAVLAGMVGATASVELNAQDLALEEVVVTARKRS